ncbi:histidine-containing phosphotransfer protein 1 [Brachypodium distachyon]|uniref:Histidine-containing phosphotransfer protein n=1 Tax=Brachypodium distachyon TaxID=15368 RepID=I1I9F6_BRADI|nr:histidine-containing phosphotransfer protein 1 [Brachypodium distachyon]KQJ99351.1 hypothetical protein BRADI_3g42770v3 [Brachypodium distachyon]|eukprot:XP_003574926.1 histidine-containing phosphotransfer protein 1 [Brachypodium distachyon]
MAAFSLVHQLHGFITSMFSDGLLDGQFQILQSLQDSSAPHFVRETITLFCDDGERIIRELAKLLEKPSVDFERVDAFVHQLKGSSSSVGAQRVKNTCLQFIEFCREKNRAGCMRTLRSLRNEFYDVRAKFQTMLQLVQLVQAK